jgi:chemotaxis protein CheD
VLEREGLPPALEGFEHVRRYRDRNSGYCVAKVLPGDFYVTREDEMLDTVLGSCVSACIRNPRLGIGGMNHFMLPAPMAGSTSDNWSLAARGAVYGTSSMEHLINRILRIGGTRSDLEVKVFGGGHVLTTMTAVGSNNVKFVREFLQQEGLYIAAEDLGDAFPRHVQYFPHSGRARVRRLDALQSRRLVNEEQTYMKGLEKAPVSGSVELF